MTKKHVPLIPFPFCDSSAYIGGNKKSSDSAVRLTCNSLVLSVLLPTPDDPTMTSIFLLNGLMSVTSS